MNANNLKNSSKTNWARIDQMTDKEVDTSDIPPLDDAFFANAKLRVPDGTVPIVMSVDGDVLEWFKGRGAEYQHPIDVAVRAYGEPHRESRRCPRRVTAPLLVRPCEIPFPLERI